MHDKATAKLYAKMVAAMRNGLEALAEHALDQDDAEAMPPALLRAFSNLKHAVWNLQVELERARQPLREAAYQAGLRFNNDPDVAGRYNGLACDAANYFHAGAHRPAPAGAGEVRQLREDCLRLGDMVEGFKTDLADLSNEMAHLSEEMIVLRSTVGRLVDAAADDLPDDPGEKGMGPSE